MSNRGHLATPNRTGVLIVVLACLVVGWPVIWHDFTLVDDPLEIYANPIFAPINLETWKSVWSAPDFSLIYIPLNYSVLAVLTSLGRWLAGTGASGMPAPMPFHIAGLFLHVINSVLALQLFRVAVRTLGGENRKGFLYHFGSVLGALLFALHPAQVEGFARAGNITITLGAFFGLSALLVDFRAVMRGNYWFGAGATAILILGLLTRPSLVVWPAIAALLTVAAFPHRWKFCIVWLGIRLLLSLSYVALTVHLQQIVPASQRVHLAWWKRPLIAADSLFWYAADVLRPTRLCIHYGRTPDVILSSSTWWMGLIGVAAGGFLVWASLRAKQKLIALGVCVFVLAVLPTSGLVPAPAREHFSVVYDRHLYFAMIGMGMTALGLLKLMKPAFRVPAALVVLTSCVLVSSRTLGYWRNALTLSQQIVSVNPLSWYGHGQLGTALLNAARPAEAVLHLERAVQLEPRFTPDCRVSLGKALIQLGRLDDAERVLMEALQQSPTDAHLHNNIGVVAIEKKNWAVAERALREAVRRDSTNGHAWNNLGLVLGEQKRTAEAIGCHEEAIRLLPEWPTARFSLGRALVAGGNLRDGMKAMEAACNLAPNEAGWRLEFEMVQSKIKKPSTP
ncbi:MAG: tetratricopeptide repeat protein [Verrucomicrobiales bacterium]